VIDIFYDFRQDIDEFSSFHNNHQLNKGGEAVEKDQRSQVSLQEEKDSGD